eukprot:PhM_4_TR7967/c0_g1_i1/m.90427
MATTTGFDDVLHLGTNAADSTKTSAPFSEPSTPPSPNFSDNNGTSLPYLGTCILKNRNLRDYFKPLQILERLTLQKTSQQRHKYLVELLVRTLRNEKYTDVFIPSKPEPFNPRNEQLQEFHTIMLSCWAALPKYSPTSEADVEHEGLHPNTFIAWAECMYMELAPVISGVSSNEKAKRFLKTIATAEWRALMRTVPTSDSAKPMPFETFSQYLTDCLNEWCLTGSMSEVCAVFRTLMPLVLEKRDFARTIPTALTRRKTRFMKRSAGTTGSSTSLGGGSVARRLHMQQHQRRRGFHGTSSKPTSPSAPTLPPPSKPRPPRLSHCRSSLVSPEAAAAAAVASVAGRQQRKSVVFIQAPPTPSQSGSPVFSSRQSSARFDRHASGGSSSSFTPQMMAPTIPWTNSNANMKAAMEDPVTPWLSSQAHSFTMDPQRRTSSGRAFASSGRWDDIPQIEGSADDCDLTVTTFTKSSRQSVSGFFVMSDDVLRRVKLSPGELARIDSVMTIRDITPYQLKNDRRAQKRILESAHRLVHKNLVAEFAASLEENESKLHEKLQTMVRNEAKRVGEILDIFMTKTDWEPQNTPITYALVEEMLADIDITTTREVKESIVVQLERLDVIDWETLTIAIMTAPKFAERPEKTHTHRRPPSPGQTPAVSAAKFQMHPKSAIYEPPITVQPPVPPPRIGASAAAPAPRPRPVLRRAHLSDATITYPCDKRNTIEHIVMDRFKRHCKDYLVSEMDGVCPMKYTATTPRGCKDGIADPIGLSYDILSSIEAYEDHVYPLPNPGLDIGSRDVRGPNVYRFLSKLEKENVRSRQTFMKRKHIQNSIRRAVNEIPFEFDMEEFFASVPLPRGAANNAAHLMRSKDNNSPTMCGRTSPELTAEEILAQLEEAHDRLNEDVRVTPGLEDLPEYPPLVPCSEVEAVVIAASHAERDHRADSLRRHFSMSMASDSAASDSVEGSSFNSQPDDLKFV